MGVDDQEDLRVFIEGRVISLPFSFVRGGHPGGEKILRAFEGRDATEEFAVIHPPYVARTLLKKYAVDNEKAPNFSGSKEEEALEESFRQLRMKLQSSGELVPHSPGAFMWGKLTATAAPGIVALLCCNQHLWVFASFMLGLFFACVGTFSHDVGHFHRQQIGPFMRAIPGIFLGASLSWWNSLHWSHHMNPNDEVNDPDACMSFCCWTMNQIRAQLQGGPRGWSMKRWYFARQHYFFYAMLLLLRPAYTFNSIRAGTAKERAFLALHIFLFYILPLRFAPAWFVLISHALGGFLSGLIVTGNHYQEMVRHSSQDNSTAVTDGKRRTSSMKYYKRQLTNTAGFRNVESRLLRFFLRFYYGKYFCIVAPCLT